MINRNSAHCMYLVKCPFSYCRKKPILQWKVFPQYCAALLVLHWDYCTWANCNVNAIYCAALTSIISKFWYVTSLMLDNIFWMWAVVGEWMKCKELWKQLTCFLALGISLENGPLEKILVNWVLVKSLLWCQVATCQKCQTLPASCCSVQILHWAILSVRNARRLASLSRDAILYSNVPMALATPDAPQTRCAYWNQWEKTRITCFLLQDVCMSRANRPCSSQ